MILYNNYFNTNNDIIYLLFLICLIDINMIKKTSIKEYERSAVEEAGIPSYYLNIYQ